MKVIFNPTLAMILFALVQSTTVFAAETPATLKGVTVVSAEQVKGMLDKGVPVIDTRVAAEYAESHIKGAVSVPYKEKSEKSVSFDSSVDSFDLTKLPADKKSPIVLYCNAGECWKSYKASVLALKAGHSSINWFRGGIPEWKKKGLPIE